MLVELSRHAVRVSDPQFAARHATAQVFAKKFTLLDQLSVGFDGASGGTMRIRAVLPVTERPFYRLTPVDMGASRWLTLEHTLDVANLRKLGEVVPVLEASSSRSVSLFALLRVVLDNKQFADTSSAQIELRREPRARSVPISFDDLPRDALASAKSARLIFFIEARDVDIDFYGLTVLGVERSEPGAVASELDTLRSAELKGASNVVKQVLDIGVMEPSGRIDDFQELPGGVNVDVDSERAQYIHYRVRKNKVQFDYAKAATSRWRSFEFRFSEIKHSDWITALVSMQGSAQGDGAWTPIPILIRRYGQDGWDDSKPVATLDVERREAESVATIDVTPWLADDVEVHTFGLVLFVPAGCATLKFSKFESLIYDRGSDLGIVASMDHRLRASRMGKIVRRVAATGRTHGVVNAVIKSVRSG